MKERGARRIILKPVLFIFFLAVSSYLVYYGSRGIQNPAIHQILAALFGLLYFVSIFFGPLYIYTHTYRRGVSPTGRILASSLIPFLWMTKDVLVLTESHPFLECLYWYLNPMYIWMACLLAIEMGLGTLLARYILKRQGQSIQVLSFAPLAAIVTGTLVFAGIYAWGQGENLFSLYLDGYRLLFGLGTWASTIMTPEPGHQADRKACSRRQALKLVGTTLAAGLTASLWPRGSHQAGGVDSASPRRTTCVNAGRPVDTPNAQVPGMRPNIVFILGDNHNFETMGCAGHPFIQTPGLDRMAEEGVRFQNTFSPTSLCSPSRATILTGAYAHTHGVKNNHTPWTGQMTTFLQYLSQSGYATAFIGKWHMPGEGLPELPFLDLFVSYTYREGQGAYFNCPLIVNGEAVPSRHAYITTEITDYAIEFIKENLAQGQEHGRPFCVYLSHRPGHPPFQAPEGIAGMYDGADVEDLLPGHVDPWWYGKANGNVFQGVMMGSYYDQYRRYCETLTAMDRDIVRLLEFLDQANLRENTVVVYMGDNGMQWGTHDCHGIREPYEESIGLPFILCAPWLIRAPGGLRGQMALNLDIAPTLLDIAGIPIPQAMDGQSLVPILTNPETVGRASFLLEFWRYFPENTPSYLGIRTERFKYVEFERGREPWLFDLQDDPGEHTNLYGTAEGERILPQLKAWMAASNGC